MAEGCVGRTLVTYLVFLDFAAQLQLLMGERKPIAIPVEEGRPDSLPVANTSSSGRKVSRLRKRAVREGYLILQQEHLPCERATLFVFDPERLEQFKKP
jgi:hypothetical protein